MKSRPGAADRSAEFVALYQRHSREVWAVAYARTLDGDLAADIAQEAFLRLWREWETGQRIENPRRWMLRVARNLAEDDAKSAFRRNGTCEPQVLTGFESRESLPLDRVLQRERREQVRAVLAELAETDREILTLRYGLEYETAEIAEILGINPAAVLMRLSRARQRLAERLKEKGVTEP
ncbi:MAG: sigma-70 family RNA polymerase sigma factor [Gemmatales bacterium]|nr:sigma-70 family RNA polymerase sigma factor [Gemmatales bacterium]MDW8386108.1 sigma-70 family RNA polymerase sigma factor [Gemmatales bacterium]